MMKTLKIYTTSIMPNHKFLLLLFYLLVGIIVKAQQEPQYTQYMYFTQVVNPAYIGSREDFNFGGLYRAQWVGLEGSPRTLTMIASTPIAFRTGLGVSVVRDDIGPANQTYVTLDFSYNIDLSDRAQLAFGLKGGGSMLNVDFTQLNVYNTGDSFEYNIDHRFMPQIGAGLYMFTDKFFASYSIPNFLETEHFDKSTIISQNYSQSIANERMHHYILAGYHFEMSSNIEFRPVFLSKIVSGAPVQLDMSANFKLYEQFFTGVSYRWTSAISALVGFQLTDSLMLGLAYDMDTNRSLAYNKGSYEFFLRYQVFDRDCCP